MKTLKELNERLDAIVKELEETKVKHKEASYSGECIFCTSLADEAAYIKAELRIRDPG